MTAAARPSRRLLVGLAFLAPNIAGFLAFTLLPLAFSLVLALTNWDLRLHNMFKDEPLRFVGLGNFIDLLGEPDFRRFLGNTLFLMMGIPFGIAGSLLAAVLLSRDLRGRRRTHAWLLAGSILLAASVFLALQGAGAGAMALVVAGLGGLILVAGAAGGTTVYRTLFYAPHFTAGVATFILWQKLYNPHTGPINATLRPVLAWIAAAVRALPAPAVRAGTWGCAGLILLLVLYGLRRLLALWRDGEMGTLGAALGGLLVLAVPGAAPLASASPPAGLALAAAAAAVLAAALARAAAGRGFRCRFDEALGHGLLLGAAAMIGQFILLGLGNVLHHLPAMASDGLTPPEWLTEYHWAKPAIMIMAFWAAVGSNNMLLYLAGLSNVPVELLEAAEIDGASPRQRFRHVVWPQLAPVTFFIVVISTIAGLKGGFEMARTMTNGGPAGATTTLSYFVYIEGFETGRLGYASGIAWTLFLLVFLVTVLNWKFGNRYVND